MPINYLEKFLPPTMEHSDIVIGSREIKGARRIGEPKARHVMGRIYNLLTRLIFGMNISDTQCGFKCFRWKNVESIFAKQCINGFAFDMEVLFLAKKSNLINRRKFISYILSIPALVNIPKISFSSDPDVIVIGAGVSGLAATEYLLKKGKSVMQSMIPYEIHIETGLMIDTEYEFNLAKLILENRKKH